MDITGTYSFPAPPARVWELLMDAGAIASCVPGCDSLEPDGENRYRARLSVAMASISGTYDGTVVISDLVAPESYRLIVEGQGRPGFVKGNAMIVLRPDAGGTIVEVHGTVQTGGPIARMGQRIIGGVAKMMQDRFFTCMQGKTAARP
jgi:carbon monoxide dehydrogenase subunit G